MDCKEAEQYVQPYIDGTMGDRELGAYLSHIRSCPACRRNLQIYFSICYLLQYVGQDEQGELDYDMRKALEEDIRRNEHGLRIRMVFRTIRHLAVIIGEAVMVAALFWSFFGETAEEFLRHLGF